MDREISGTSRRWTEGTQSEETGLLLSLETLTF